MSKNYVIIMVALVALVLMVLPVSAVTAPFGKMIGPGATVFLGEEGLDISLAMGSYDTIGYWAAGADLDTSSPYTIQVTGRLHSFSVSQSEFGGYLGSWYRVNSTGKANGLAFSVVDPKLSVSIRNAADDTNVNGKTVIAGTNLTFKLDTNIILNDKRGDAFVTITAPVSKFTVTASGNVAHFTPDITTGSNPIVYNWSFGDGTYSSASTVDHTYAVGTWIPVLTVSNPNIGGTPSTNSTTVTISALTYGQTLGSSTHVNSDNVLAPDADFTINTDGTTGVVTFTDMSTNSPNAWAWNFGDGNISTLQSPTHNYAIKSGSHTVTLEAYNTGVTGTHSTETSQFTITTSYSGSVSGVYSSVAPSIPSLDAFTLNPTSGYMDIVVKSSTGTVYSSLYNAANHTPVTLKNQLVTSSPYYWNGGSSMGSVWETAAKDTNSQRVYQTGIYSVYVDCNLNGMKDNYKVSGKSTSEVQTVTLGSDTLSLDIDKNSVVRGKQFTVTLTGKPTAGYTVYLKGISPSATNAPTFVLYQEGVTPIGGSNNASIITTDSSGVRTIAFTTDSNTKDQKYTIKAVSNSDTTKYDEISISVAKGGVTIVASGSQVYYLGEEIKLSGTNTETDTTYFFMVGPNLNANGVGLVITDVGVTSSGGHFETATVQSDDTWKYDWQTSSLDLDAGTYTVYAVSLPVDKADLGTAAYGSTSITIKKPFVSAAVSQPTIAKGDKLYIEGTAEGNPSSVTIWILGKNYAKVNSQSVDSDSTYKYEVTSADTADLASGQYFVVVQHPMQNAAFDVYQDGNYVYKNQGDLTPISIFKLQGSGSLQGSDAAEALIQAINDPNIDDAYTKLNFLIQEPLIAIDPIANKNIGDKFTLTGKTNLAVADEILVEIYSSSFKPTDKTQNGEFSGATGNVLVNKSETGLNSFALTVDTTSFKADEYIVVAQGVTQDATGTALFNVVTSGAPVTTTAPVGTPTQSVTPIVTAPTPIVTAPPTVIPTPSIPVPTETTKSPGFGAVFALIGLGAVGFIVVRRH